MLYIFTNYKIRMLHITIIINMARLSARHHTSIHYCNSVHTAAQVRVPIYLYTDYTGITCLIAGDN